MFIRLNCAMCVRSGHVSTNPGLRLYYKCGNRTNAKLPMDNSMVRRELGIFEKKNIHIEQIQQHTSLWEIADDICPHINPLKIFSGLIVAQIIRLSQSSWKW